MGMSHFKYEGAAAISQRHFDSRPVTAHTDCDWFTPYDSLSKTLSFDLDEPSDGWKTVYINRKPKQIK